MDISHSEGLEKRGAQSLQATLPWKQFGFLHRWRSQSPGYSHASSQILLPPHHRALASLGTRVSSKTLPAPSSHSSAKGDPQQQSPTCASAKCRVSKVREEEDGAEEESTVPELQQGSPEQVRLQSSSAARHGRFCLCPCSGTGHDTSVIATGSAEAAEGQRFHAVLRVTGSAKGNYWVLGVEFPDLTTLLKYNRGLLR